MSEASEQFNNKMRKMRVESELENIRQDNTSRSRIAYCFTLAFIAITSVIIVGGPIYNATLEKESPLDVAQLLSNFVAQFGTPLGFVLGYYFKDKNNS